MKAQILLPILTIAAGIAARAQAPNIPPPPPPPPQSPGDAQRQGPGPQDDRREHYRKMAEQFRRHHGPAGADQPQVNPRERAEHISEALKHLKAAGLGPMAARIEEMLKKMHDGPGRGKSRSGPPQAQQQRPQRPPGPPPFGRPAPIPPGGPRAHGAPGARPDAGGVGELREQVQKLARQVEELRNSIGRRMEEPRGGPRGGEHPEGRPAPRRDQPDAKPPGGDEHKSRRPEGDRPQVKPQGGGEHPERRPQGDQPPRPPGDGPRRESRDTPPERKREGAEQIKPAVLPQSDSIE